MIPILFMNAVAGYHMTIERRFHCKGAQTVLLQYSNTSLESCRPLCLVFVKHNASDDLRVHMMFLLQTIRQTLSFSL